MGQRIQKVEIINLKCIDHQEVELDGNNVYMIGGNNQGKTTFIDACHGQLPKEALKKGERKGEVVITIDDYVIEFKMTTKNTKGKLNIFDREGRPQKAPANLFKELFGVVDFEIDKFLSLAESKQIDFIKEIIGIDWTDLDNKRKDLYEDRTFKNRKLKELDARLTGKMPEKGLVKVDIELLMSKLSKANEVNSNVSRGWDKIKSQSEEIEGVDEAVKYHLSEIKKLNNQKEELQNSNSKIDSWLKKNPEVSTEGIEYEIKTATENNEKIALQSQFNEEREESKKLTKEVDSLSKEIESIDEVKRKELSKANIPVKGLTFDENGLYLNGIPFKSDQINTASRIIAGIEIQHALCGEVKISRFDGSLLDKNSMKIVKDWAEEKGVQLFVEIVDRDGSDLKIEVEEVSND